MRTRGVEMIVPERKWSMGESAPLARSLCGGYASPPPILARAPVDQAARVQPFAARPLFRHDLRARRCMHVRGGGGEDGATQRGRADRQEMLDGYSDASSEYHVGRIHRHAESPAWDRRHTRDDEPPRRPPRCRGAACCAPTIRRTTTTTPTAAARPATPARQDGWPAVTIGIPWSDREKLQRGDYESDPRSVRSAARICLATRLFRSHHPN